MPATISSLLTLLDDENETVQKSVQEALLQYEGDATDEIVASGIRLKKREAHLLSKHLQPGRRQVLRKEWSIPTARLSAVDGDWDSLEAILRLLSDFLHDGITIRQSLSDELDQLAELAEHHVQSPLELANFLFATQKLSGNRTSPLNPKNADLAWCIEQGESNPLGLSLIFMLVGHRLSVPVFGCNYPGHFLALIDSRGEPTLIDCFHNARPTTIKELLKKHQNLSKNAKTALSQPCTLLDMLRRLLNNLHFSFAKTGREKDANLIKELMQTVSL